MATIPAYVDALTTAALAIARKRGVLAARTDKQTRVIFLALLTILATLAKAIVDKGLLTNAELQAALDLAASDTYADEPVEPPDT